MDKYNTFHTKTAYNLERLDYGVIMLSLLAAVAMNWQQTHWGAFIASFLIIDLIGTVPGMYCYYARRSGKHKSIPKIFYVLYNSAHSFFTIGFIALLWFFIVGQWEWAMLAMPIHLCGDRSVFGNTYKPFQLSFEPVKHQLFQEFQNKVNREKHW